MSEKQESSVLVDALPYIDLGYDQAARESVGVFSKFISCIKM